MSKLQNIYDAAVAKLGTDLPLALARAFGGIAGPDDVPAERRDGLAAALKRITNGGGISAAMAARAAHGDPSPAPPRRASVSDGESVFRSIRAEAYGTDEDGAPEAPKSFDEIAAQAYARWNRMRQTTD